MNEIEALFDNLERLAGDPVFDGLMADVQEMNDYLQLHPIEEGEAEEIEFDLNAKLYETHITGGSPLKVSGTVYILNDEDEGDGVPELDRETQTEYRAYDMMLLQFKILTSGGQPQIYLCADGLIQEDQEDDDEEPEETYVTYVIPMDGQTVVSYEGESKERSGAWLEFNHPEVKEELEQIVGNANSETEAVMALAGFKIEAANLSDEDLLEYTTHLRAFTKSLIEFEKYPLYVAELIGEVSVYDEGENTTIKDTITSVDETIVGLNKIDFTLSDDEQWLEPVVDARIRRGKQSELSMQIPPATFYSLISIIDERQKAIDARKGKK